MILRRLAIAATLAVVATATAAIPGAADAATLTGVQYVNDGSSKCLDVRSEDGSYTAGARVQQYRCKDDSGNQRWILVGAVNGFYNLVNTQSRLCLDVTGASQDDGAPTQQWFCNGAANQLWAVHFDGHFYQIWSGNSRKCLDVRNGSHADHAIVQQWECNGTAAQRWLAVAIS